MSSLLATLTIASLELKTTIGALSFERQIKQTLLLDVSLKLDITEASATDDLNTTLNYADLTAELQQTAAEQHCQLIETLAARLQQTIITSYPQVLSGKLVLHKKGAVPKTRGISITIEW